MGLKKIILGGNEFQLTTKTEQRLFELVCFERKQNQDLVRFVEELNRDIKDQQELLENLAEHLKIYKNTDNNNIHDDSDVEDFPPSSPQESKDEEGPSSDQETEPELQKNIRKRKLSASSDEDDLVKKNESEEDDLIKKNDTEHDDLINKNESDEEDENKSQ